jgi:hypothetical protein
MWSNDHLWGVGLDGGAARCPTVEGKMNEGFRVWQCNLVGEQTHGMN